MSAVSPARRAALRVVHEVVRGGATLADRLAQPAIESLPGRDRDFLHELVHGTLRRRGALDFVLRRLINRSIESVDPMVLDILRLGAYQILHTRVPDRAAVFESVSLAREVAPHASGFANAVLRRAARPGGPPAPPSPTADPLGWLTSEGSLPPWLAQRWLAELGAGVAVARASAFLEVPETFVRLNPRITDAAARTTEAGVRLRSSDVPGSFVVEAGKVQALAAAGVVYVLDEGSQLIARLAASERGTLLDACAAPGGKTLVAADLGSTTRVVALEPSLRRLRVLARTVQRWGASNVSVVGADALRPPLRPRFQSVLLDAPCSGLGTLARRPDLRWRLNAADIPRHAARQRALLEAVGPLVVQGGRLVYSTCSLEPEETHEVVATFLASGNGRNFVLCDPPAEASRFSEDRYVRLRPEVRGGDGFFAALLRRQN